MGSVMTRRTTISYVQQLRNPASDNYTVEPLELTLSFSSGLFSWLSSQKQNNMTHAYFGNIGIGVGVLTVYIRIKGCLSLHIKKSDIENIIKDYNPHVLGLGEANFWHDHDRADSEQPGYELHLDSSLDNLELGVARVAVYARKSFKVTRRADVECKNVSAVSLQCGLPHQKSILMCIGYRQWRLMGQPDNTSASIHQQLSRWLAFLEIWEKALSENKEVITALDANLDFLTWRTDDLPKNHRSVKLKSCLKELLAP